MSDSTPQPSSRKRPYGATDLSPDTRDLIGRMIVTSKRPRDATATMQQNLARAGAVVSSRSLRRYAAAAREGRSALSQDKSSGRKSKLDDSQKDIIFGFVLHCNAISQNVSLKAIVDEVMKQFGVTVDGSVVARWLSAAGFARRRVSTRKSTYGLDAAALARMIWEWVSTYRNEIRNVPAADLLSIDVTYTAKSYYETTYAPVGAPQPRSRQLVTAFTNAIYTCLDASGSRRYPCLMFTFNHNFREDRNPTPRRALILEHLAAQMKLNGIQARRIVYVGKDKGETRKFVRESPELTRLAISIWNLPKRCVVMTDGGNFAKDKDVDVFSPRRHLVYWSKIHMFVSMNDNSLHGVAKQRWRMSGIDFEDDVASTLRLMHEIDLAQVKYSQGWFKRNLLDVTEASAVELVSSAPGALSEENLARLRAYRIHCGLDARGSRDHIPEDMRDSLDGSYWQYGVY